MTPISFLGYRIDPALSPVRRPNVTHRRSK
jgi:hypothetical protein